MNDSKPKLSRRNVQEVFSGCGSRFDFTNVPIATQYGADFYLLEGSNAQAFLQDIEYVNEITAEAQSILDRVPSFYVQPSEVAFSPTYFNSEWQFCAMRPQPRTKTGNLPKYSMTVWFRSKTARIDGEIFYTSFNEIGKGTVINRESGMFVLKFMNQHITHIETITGTGEKLQLYNAKPQTRQAPKKEPPAKKGFLWRLFGE